MTERIQELARQATTIEYGVDNGFDRVTFDKEKFAELIVAECAQAVFDTELDDCCSDSDVICAVSFHLKKHFGVEE